VKIVNVEEMRGIEQATDARGHSFPAMMDMAGQAVGARWFCVTPTSQR